MKKAFQIPYPRSFLGLLIAGFALVSAPLVAALGYSAWSTEHLAEQSRTAVFQAAQAARSSRSLVNRASAMERIANRVLSEGPDAESRLELGRIHRNFKQVARDLQRLPLETEQLGALYRTVAHEQALYEALASEQTRSSDADRVRSTGADLTDSAGEVLAISYLAADRESEQLRTQAESVQRNLLLLVLLGSALALVVAVALTRLIGRPIGELDAAIRSLGDADFGQPIRVRGPADLRALGDRLDWLRRRLLELETNRNRMLRHLSHELKTPLTVLREGADLLNGPIAGTLAEPQRRVVAIMRDNGARLHRMIEALLHRQQELHAGVEPARVPVSLDELVRDAARSHAVTARVSGQHLVLELEPVRIQADVTQVTSIVDNLIGNAVKFTPAGGTITVWLRATALGATLDIVDSGPGVGDAERDAIFDSFYRGSAAGAGGIQGSGLGLAIAREYAEAHGGRIAVLGEGHGAHFRLTLPMQGGADLGLAA